MKILQLVTKRQYRGAEVFAANLSEELIKRGHQIIFAGLYKNGKNVLKVHDADNRDLIDVNKGFSFKLVQEIIKLIKKERPDVVQCNGSDTLKYMIAASFFIPKTPITYRNISIMSVWLQGRPKRLLYQNMFKRIDHVTSVGYQSLEDLVTVLNYPKEQTSVIRRGIPIKELDVNSSADLVKGFNLLPSDKIVVHIGNFSQEKNHQFLLQVFSEIKKEHPEIKLILVGKGTLFDEIKQQVKIMNLEQAVFLAGFRKDIPEILAASQCFVLCSKVEGVPGVILEAAAQKVPAVATNVGGVKEVLIDNETGFVIDGFDKNKFKEKLLEILTNEPLRLKLGENAYKMVVEEFNPSRNAEKFENLYNNLIHQH